MRRLAVLLAVWRDAAASDASCRDTALDAHDGKDPPEGFVSCEEEKAHGRCASGGAPTAWASEFCRATCGECVAPECAPRCHSTPMSWNDARAYCGATYGGATLASVRDAATNAWLKANGPFDDRNACAWTGFNDKATEGAWSWKNGDAPTGYEDWHAGEPNDGFGAEDCMAICGAERHGWHDFVCASPWPFCCEPRDDCAPRAGDAPARDAPATPGDANFCEFNGFSAESFTPARVAAAGLTCEAASVDAAYEWARCCCGHAASCRPDGDDEAGLADGGDEGDDNDAWRSARSGDSDRRPPAGHPFMLVLLGVLLLLLALVSCWRKIAGDRRSSAGRGDYRGFGTGSALAAVPARDEATGLELEIADGVEMM